MTESDAFTPERALKLRARVKGKKPEFVRPESWRYVRLKENWRRPKGLDHKVRLSYKGWPPAAGSGYGGPKVAKGLHPSGYREVLVYNVEQLAAVDPKIQAVRIAHTVGKRKRTRLLTEARKKQIVILNLREATQMAEKKIEEEKGKEDTEKVKEEATEETEQTETEKQKTEEKPKKRGRRAQ